MRPFKIVHNIYDIDVSSKWHDAHKFNNKGVIKTYKGRGYRLISKKERKFSTIERIGRIALGTLASVCTLGLALLSRTIRELFTKKKKNIRYATLIKTSQELIKELQGTDLQIDKDIQAQLQKDYSALNGHIKIRNQVIDMGKPAFAENRGTGLPVPDTFEEMFPQEIQDYFGDEFHSLAPSLALLLQQGSAAELTLKALEQIKDPIEDRVFKIPYPDYAFYKMNGDFFLLMQACGSLIDTSDQTSHGNYTASQLINLSNPGALVIFNLVKD